MAYCHPSMNGAMTPPLLDTHVEDEEVEREEDDVGEGDDDSAGCGEGALYEERIEEIERRGKGNIEGREGVHGHGLWERTRSEKKDGRGEPYFFKCFCIHHNSN